MRIEEFRQTASEACETVEAVLVTGRGRAHTMSVEIRPGLEGRTLDRADFAVLPALLIAVVSGEDLEIAVPVSRRLAMGLDDIADILAHQHSAARRPEISVGTLLGRPETLGEGVLTGFSRGVDCYDVLTDFLWEPAPGVRPITRLCFSIVSAPRRQNRRIGEVVEVARGHAETLGLPFTVLDCDFEALFREALPDGPALPIGRSITVRNIAMAHAMAPLAARFLYAASHPFSECTVEPTEDMTFADAILLPLMSSDAVDCIAVGGSRRRIDKLTRIASRPFVQRSLDVCWARETARTVPHHLNCSACEKCLRTLLSLEILGELPTYAEVFDLDVYATHRQAYARAVLTAPTSYRGEVAELAEARGFDLAAVAGSPVSVWAGKVRHKVPKPLKRALKRMFRLG